MLTEKELLGAYVWELEFEDGTRLDRTEWLRVPKPKRMDPNKPERVVKFVRLKPQQQDLMPLEVFIPQNCLPVVIREQRRAQAVELFGVVFKAGFNLNGVRHMICVSLPEKKIFQQLDNLGCKNG